MSMRSPGSEKWLLQNLLSFALFLGIFAFGAYHSTKGIDFTDEGYYITASQRIALGDVPIRDEVLPTFTLFNVILSPVFLIVPGITLLQIRLIGYAIHLASLLTAFLFFRRYSPPLLAALLTTIVGLLNNFLGMMVPSYNLLGSDLLTVALSAWLYGITHEAVRTTWKGMCAAIAGGMAFSIATLAYPTEIVLLLIPIAYVIVSRKEKRNPAVLSLIFIGSSVFILLVAGIALVSSGLVPYWLQNYRLWKGFLLPTGGSVRTALGLLQAFPSISPNRVVIPVLIVLGLGLCLRRRMPRVQMLLSTTYLIVFAVAVTIAPQQKNLTTLFFSIVLLVIALLLKGKEVDAKWKLVMVLSACWGLASSSVFLLSTHYFNYTRSYIAAFQGIGPVFIVVMISLHRFLAAESNRVEGSAISETNHGWHKRQLLERTLSFWTRTLVSWTVITILLLVGGTILRSGFGSQWVVSFLRATTHLIHGGNWLPGILAKLGTAFQLVGIVLACLFVIPGIAIKIKGARDFIFALWQGKLDRKMALGVLYLAAVVIFGNSLFFHYNMIYRNPDINRLSVPMRSARLRGIESTLETEQSVDNLVDYLHEKMKPKDFLLAFDKVPLIYFISDTRPAFGLSWADNEYPKRLTESLIGKMVKEGRTPDYCVQMLLKPGSTEAIDYSDSPLYVFVQGNYVVEKEISPFVVWRKRQGLGQ